MALSNFIVQYHHFLIAFVISTFISQFVGEAALGIVVSGASFIMVLTLLSAPSIFTSFGTRHTLVVLGLLQILALLGLSMATTELAVIALYIIQGVLTYAMFIGVDLLVEASTCREADTGNTRGLFLTTSNISAVIATFTLSLLVVGDQYSLIFVSAAIALIPFILLALYVLPPISHVSAPSAALPSSVITALRESATLRAVVGAHFLLQLFFAWMVIYSPILLHDYYNFSWAEIGIMLSIAMVPYVVLEYPLGLIADYWLGEKEILTLGFVILAVAVALMAFMGPASLMLWIAVLVLSRVGAAMVEVMTETHFFKQVSTSDPAAISTFRILRPLGAVVAPLIATLTLLVVPFPQMFGIFAIIMVIGIPISLSIIDSK